MYRQILDPSLTEVSISEDTVTITLTGWAAEELKLLYAMSKWLSDKLGYDITVTNYNEVTDSTGTVKQTVIPYVGKNQQFRNYTYAGFVEDLKKEMDVR